MGWNRLLLVFGFLLGVSPVFSVDPDLILQRSLPPSEPVSPEVTLSADNQITELQTAGYYELVARARELGLPQTGGVPELRQRIAQAEGLTLPAETPKKGRTLTIDSAQQAGLITVEAPGDGKLLRLSGGVQVTLVDQEKKVTHVIEAGELWYDQANEEMTARGQVVYTMIRENRPRCFGATA